MKNELKILLFAKSLDGGTGAFIEQLAPLKKISHTKVKVKVIALEKPSWRVTNNRSKILFFKRITAPAYYFLSLSTLFSLVHEFRWLKTITKEFEPDIILSVDTHCNVLCGAYKLLSGTRTRIVLTVHNNISAVSAAKTSWLSQTIIKYVGHYLFNLADEVVAVSNGVANNTKKFFSLHKKPKVIHVSLNEHLVKRLAKKPLKKNIKTLFSTHHPAIISVGRFVPQKDFSTLITAFASVNRKYKKSALFLVGDGPEKQTLIKLVKSLHLTTSVFFLGWQQNVYPYIKAADIFVLSSNYEGFPYVLLEAATLEKPIVSTDVPFGPSEFLDRGKYGLLVPPQKPAKLAHQLTTIIRNQTKYSLKSQQRVKDFTERKMLDKYQQLFTRITQT